MTFALTALSVNSSAALMASASQNQIAALTTANTAPLSSSRYLAPAATGLATVLSASPALAQDAAPIPETPAIGDIFGPTANNGIGDIPITELPGAPDHTLAWGLVASLLPALLRLPASAISSIPVVKHVVPKSFRQTTNQALETSGLIHSLNYFVGRVAESRLGSITAHIRNLAALYISADSIVTSIDPFQIDILRYWADSPELLLPVIVATSWTTRAISWWKGRKLRQAGVAASEVREMRRHALGFLPKSMPSAAEHPPTNNNS